MPFVVPIKCGGKIHNLVLTRDGRMTSLGDEHDFGLETALGELGAQLPHCAWHYKRWMDNPLLWVQGPLFGAWRDEARMDRHVFGEPLGIFWQPQDFKFLSCLLLLDAAEHVSNQLSDSYGQYGKEFFTRPLKHGRRAFWTVKSRQDTAYVIRDIQAVRHDTRDDIVIPAADASIMSFITDAASWCHDWFYDTDLKGIKALYSTYLTLGDPKELDLWLRRRIATVLESLIEEKRWPSIS